MSLSSEPVVNNPYIAINGIIPFNDATTPNTLLDISAGICRDSTNTFDMNLGNFLGANPNISANTVTVINAAANGLNGLDQGTFAASTVYNIYAVGDSTGYNQTAAMISTAAIPFMPFGYDLYRLIGYWATDSSTHFLKGYVFGNNGERTFMYDAIQPTAVTAGAATAYTAVTLAGLVPAVDKIPVTLSLGLTPNAASDTLSIRKTNGTGDYFVMKGQVASVQVLEQVKILSGLASGAAKIDYKVSAGTDAAAISVLGYDYSL